MIKKLLFALILFMSVSNAQTIAKYAGEFLYIGVGGRPLGMGGAFTAISNDITSAYYNPAGLAYLDYPQIALMHDERYGNLVNYNYGAVALPFGADYTFSLSAMRLAIDGIFDTRNALIDYDGDGILDHPNDRIDYSKIKEFSNQDWAIYFSGAKRVFDNLYVGANFKFIYRSIAEFSAWGFGFDAGALYFLTPELILGANLQDFTTTLVSWSTGRNELISPTVKIGAAYNYTLFNRLRITPAMDFDVRFENRRFSSQFNIGPVSFDPHFGLELNYNNLFSVRAGYNDVKQITFGAGFRLPKMNIDYSFARFNYAQDDRLPDTHRISVIITLEEPRFMR